MPPAEPSPSLQRPWQNGWARVWPVALLAIALGLHLHAVTRNFSAGFLIGHEFRQTQTALSVEFIAHDQDFSLAYPTPLLGPPWTIPMEFPLYQWAAAAVRLSTKLSVAESGRAVSIFCFYLGLPALFWLVRRGSPQAPATPWAAVAGVLLSPVYLFYTRAVLIESTAWMLSLWFLVAFVEMCRRSSTGWMAFAAVVGALAALAKVTTFMVACGGAAVIGLTWSWQQWRNAGAAAWRRTVTLGIGSAVLPGIAALWWIHKSDAIKQASPATAWLSSDRMTSFNLGTWTDRTDLAGWREIGHHLTTVLAPAPVLILGLVAAIALALRGRRLALWCWVWLGATLFTFPVLYRHHDYYFYGAAALGSVGLAAVLCPPRRARGLFQIAAPILLTLLLGTQFALYRKHYQPDQLIESNGGMPIDHLIRDLLPRNEVIVVLGQDWAAATAYYSQRRALMIPNTLLDDEAGAIALLDVLDEARVSVLLVTGKGKERPAIVDAITRRFNLAPTASLRSAETDAYLSKRHESRAIFQLRAHPNYSGITLLAQGLPDALRTPIVANGEWQTIAADQAESLFSAISPAPTRYRAQFPLDAIMLEEGWGLLAHPRAEIEVPVPAGATTVRFTCGFHPDVFKQADAQTDGVDFIVLGLDAAGNATELYRKTLRQHDDPPPRGMQHVEFALPTPVPRSLSFVTDGGKSLAFDWAYWSEIVIE